MIDTIKLLLEQGLALVREGHAQRQRFYKEIVEPVHAHYLRMAERHDATFAYVNLQLSRPNCSLRTIFEEVNERLASEAKDWHIIDQVARKCDLDPRRDVERAYLYYVSSLAECLEVVHAGGDAHSIVFYRGLLNTLEIELWTSDTASSIARVREQVKDLQADYTKYCAKVETGLLMLKRACTV
ncbi:hypothetical protein [Methyloversatilis sp. XJ19-49]|uniref:hypothetical protein n=1 Tax=Methyloversatilis sp. XJ19-49 TaxID=2963429 RepID=UPI00211BE68C|nr:hypothetical protein [Methyloversatilis sp. XJ19-49]MCQ9377754.1 hypothetical protein [Methyloversatilis sp. XJ19-49]